MRRVYGLGILLAAVIGAADARAQTMQLTSTAFRAGGAIPAKYTCDGQDVSPALAWSGAPDGTKSFALVMDDPDAPPGTWVHWVLFDLPASPTSLAAHVPRTERLASGAVQGACWGVETFDRIGYQGPCPPPGKPHHYRFRLYALDTTLGLPPRAARDEVMQSARGHVLAEAELVGTYAR